MKITNTKARLAATAVVLGLGLATISAGAASAADGAWTPTGTPEPYHFWVMDTESPATAAQVLHYDTDMIAAPSATNVDQTFAEAPADATSAFVFVAPRGKEGSLADWSSRIDIGFMPNSKLVLQPTASLYQFPSSSFGAVKAAGGDYSMGLAYTKNNGTTLVAVAAYNYISITPGTADWTVQVPTQSGGGTTDPESTGQIAIEAPVAAPVDGALSLSIPTGEKATLGSAALDNTGKSVSTGTLPTFQVSDERYATKPGWTVNTSVATFTSGSNTIDPTALAIVPAVKSTSTATGVSAVSALTGAKEAAKFAEAAAGQGTGRTDLSAALTLTAPLGTPAGTYTSTMTVTVVSK
ncbi:hypothetical protein [Microbacterium binotii]|uniref:WxL domain-containing protein n=1 Tax=Microbacterium binotii TaxID=462710 RepID=A0ABP6BFH9_9MICO